MLPKCNCHKPFTCKKSSTFGKIHFSLLYSFIYLFDYYTGKYALYSKIIFTIPGPKVSHSLPAQKRECGIFGPGMVKNSIPSTGVKLASPCLVFATLTFGSGGKDKGNMDCPNFFLPRCVIYYIIKQGGKLWYVDLN